MQLLLHEFKNNRSSSFVSDLSRETSEIFKEHLLNSKSDKETVSRTIYDYRNLWPLRHFQSLTERTFNNLNLLSKSHRHWHFIQKWRPRNRWVYIRKRKKEIPVISHSLRLPCWHGNRRRSSHTNRTDKTTCWRNRKGWSEDYSSVKLQVPRQKVYKHGKRSFRMSWMDTKGVTK